MSEDPHSPRFMCYLSIPTFFMPMLVTRDNSLQLFLGWEGVGLASYLLIHFWFTRLQADKADLCHSHYASHIKLYSFQGLIIALFVTRLKLIITFFVITLIITFPESRRQV
ncbi:hypothetical protein H5410_027181 [Solanum commersonii]|uniref:NADH dehydrogenase subunit 5 n=1 Tax=Solanum commersonii TaxID=4109 RepID=A0A9J5YYI7_SOLCO|nr:hypothetical protein H5410_027181 [Solanum commersonii]